MALKGWFLSTSAVLVKSPTVLAVSTWAKLRAKVIRPIIQAKKMTEKKAIWQSLSNTDENQFLIVQFFTLFFSPKDLK